MEVMMSDAAQKCEDVAQRMREVTYIVEHNPNCPSPFLVRLVGVGRGVIDKLPVDKTYDIYAYGQSFEEAAEFALRIKDFLSGRLSGESGKKVVLKLAHNKSNARETHRLMLELQVVGFEVESEHVYNSIPRAYLESGMCATGYDKIREKFVAPFRTQYHRVSRIRPAQ